ncbi:MAG: hypothetical protein GC134_03390 [Proteobacteria bacterium]|nr:hypothetical protein [Pseudomonadota bacterium]
MRIWFAVVSVVALMAGNASAFVQTDDKHERLPVGIFSSYEVQGSGLEAFPNWRAVLARIQSEQAVYDACDKSSITCATPQLRSWRAFLQKMRDTKKSGLDMLREVNAFANRWPYRSDEQVWHKTDYWASPLEFIEHDGDCEDYAILKYVSLRALGYTDDRLRLVVVRDTIRQTGHAVLAVYPQGSGEQIYVLDSLITDVLPDTGFLQYDPYYSVNTTTRWMHVPVKKQSTLLPQQGNDKP